MPFLRFLSPEQAGRDQQGIDREQGDEARPEIKVRGLPRKGAEGGQDQQSGDKSETEKIEQDDKAEFGAFAVFLAKYQARPIGNGEIGEIVTHNAKVFTNLPLNIPFDRKFEIEGEAIITYEDFEKINAVILNVKDK